MRLSKKPILREFTIKSPSPDWGDDAKLTIRQAKIGDGIRRGEFLSEISMMVNTGFAGTELRQNINIGEIHRFEVFLTLVGCDIEDEDGNPWFTFLDGRLVDEASFKKAYNLLPPEIGEDIHDCVLEMNPQWEQDTSEAVGE